MNRIFARGADNLALPRVVQTHLNAVVACLKADFGADFLSSPRMLPRLRHVQTENAALVLLQKLVAGIGAFHRIREIGKQLQTVLQGVSVDFELAVFRLPMPFTGKTVARCVAAIAGIHGIKARKRFALVNARID